MKKISRESTMWLDFLTFIFCPLFIIFSSTRLKEYIFDKNIICMIIYFILIIISGLTFYKGFKKDKIGYLFIQIFSLSAYITTVVDLVVKYRFYNILGLIILGVISFILLGFNYFYLLSRKDIFKEHNIAHIKKCPGCNRIIPVHMESCGRCNYKEV